MWLAYVILYYNSGRESRGQDPPATATATPINEIDLNLRSFQNNHHIAVITNSIFIIL